MLAFIFVFSVHGSCYTTVSYDVVHAVFVYISVEVILFHTFGLRPKFSITSCFTY